MRMTIDLKTSLSVLVAANLLASCSLAPDMEALLPNVPASFKEAPPAPAEGWKIAEPGDAKDRGAWWKIFGDETLNALITEAQAANPSLEAARQRLEQSRATARVEEGALWPDINASGSASEQGNTTVRVPNATNPRQKPKRIYEAKGAIAYELDLFGKLSDNARAAELLADGEEAVYRSVMLALSADVAQTYFNLRRLDGELRTLNETVTIRENAEKIMKQRLDAGFTSELDYARAKAELATAQSDSLGLQKQRASEEHALAILLGKAPAEFSFEASPLPADAVMPEIPAGLPSELLERRPDIAAAQRMAEAANAKIGAARAAFFPSISLGASGGFESNNFDDLFKWVGRTWAIGPDISVPIFQGGRVFANLDRSKAEYQESVAMYRSTVLSAFREVEDALSDVRLLAEQNVTQTTAAESNKRAAELSKIRYEQGDLNFLDVVDSERNALAAERAAVQLKGAHYNATVQLIRALGGGWSIPATTTAPAEPAKEEKTPEPTPLLQPIILKEEII